MVQTRETVCSYVARQLKLRVYLLLISHFISQNLHWILHQKWQISPAIKAIKGTISSYYTFIYCIYSSHTHTGKGLVWVCKLLLGPELDFKHHQCEYTTFSAGCSCSVWGLWLIPTQPPTPTPYANFLHSIGLQWRPPVLPRLWRLQLPGALPDWKRLQWQTQPGPSGSWLQSACTSSGPGGVK